MEEIWKPIGYEGYEVSNLGRVKSYKYDKINGKIMKPYKNTKGYLQIDLQLDGRKRENRVHLSVHRLVAIAFIPDTDNLPQGNRKDEDKTHNCVDNLEWFANDYNAHYGTHIERVAEKIRVPIYSVDKQGNIEHFPGVREADRIVSGKEYGISAPISMCLNGKRKTTYVRQLFREIEI